MTALWAADVQLRAQRVAGIAGIIERYDSGNHQVPDGKAGVKVILAALESVRSGPTLTLTLTLTLSQTWERVRVYPLRQTGLGLGLLERGTQDPSLLLDLAGYLADEVGRGADPVVVGLLEHPSGILRVGGDVLLDLVYGDVVLLEDVRHLLS